MDTKDSIDKKPSDPQINLQIPVIDEIAEINRLNKSCAQSENSQSPTSSFHEISIENSDEINDDDINDKANVEVDVKTEDEIECPDGGWGWACVIGCCIVHVLIGGYGRSYGLIYTQLIQRYHSSAALTAWVNGSCSAIRMGFS